MRLTFTLVFLSSVLAGCGDARLDSKQRLYEPSKSISQGLPDDPGRKGQEGQYDRQVQEMYVAYYGRPADPGGLAYWSKRIADSGGRLDDIIQEFGSSVEADARFKSLGTEGAVTALYRQLFNRDPDSGGFDFYVNGIKTGQFTLVTVSANIFYGAPSGTADKQMLDNKVSVANQFTETLRQNSTLAEDYSGNQAASVARDFLANIGSGSGGGVLPQTEFDSVFRKLSEALSDDESSSSVTVTSSILIL